MVDPPCSEALPLRSSHKAPGDALRVDTAVLEEVLVLGADHGVNQDGRDLAVVDVHAIDATAELGHGVVGVAVGGHVGRAHERGLQQRRVLGRQGHLAEARRPPRRPPPPAPARPGRRRGAIARTKPRRVAVGPGLGLGLLARPGAGSEPRSGRRALTEVPRPATGPVAAPVVAPELRRSVPGPAGRCGRDGSRSTRGTLRRRSRRTRRDRRARARSSALVVMHRPWDGSRGPNTYETSTTLCSSQIGHGMVVASLHSRRRPDAAPGWASQTSCWARRPFLNSEMSAWRAKR